MTKILVQGDLHGNTTALDRACHFAQKNECEAVYQVGDFGFGWSQTRTGDVMLESTARRAAAYELPIYWLDGNHENFDKLEDLGVFPADALRNEPYEVAPNVFYLPRGTTVEVGGRTILAIGGAYSVDKNHRIWGRSWWPQEEITDKDLERCYAAGEVDVVLSHDAPNDAFLAALLIAANGNSMEMGHLAWKNDSRFPMAKPNRQALQSVLESAKPTIWLHGHYHAYYQAKLRGGTHVVGLDMECEENSYKVLNLDDLTV